MISDDLSLKMLKKQHKKKTKIITTNLPQMSETGQDSGVEDSGFVDY